MKCRIVLEFEDKWLKDITLDDVKKHVESCINDGEWIPIAKVVKITEISEGAMEK